MLNNINFILFAGFQFALLHFRFRFFETMVRVLFIHPDLGIGGAERLVVDAALALQQRGHTVSFLTNHHDREHCFEETRNGELRVETVGDWLPRSIFHRFSAFCAYLRMLYATIYTTFYLSRDEKFDVIFVDLISVGIPILKWASGHPKILFYCHFPDQLLTSKSGLLKQWYRIPLDFVEEKTTARADSILVNSKFTRRVFKETFKSITTMPTVLYPSLDTKYFDQTVVSDSDPDVGPLNLPDEAIVFLSINRFERKKNIPLALRAFNRMKELIPKSEWDRCHLIIAGGYDRLNTENVQHFVELTELADKLKISTKCSFLRSPSNKFKLWLIKRCNALVYTPANEHFGIVPLEAMYLRKPVIACNCGGPTETIIHETTGFLCDESHAEEEFAKAMNRFVTGDQTLSNSMGEKGRKRVQQNFSFEAFAEKLDFIIKELLKPENGSKQRSN